MADGIQLIVVDAANVIGSRPDGWWRDRAGAARRLLEQLSASALQREQQMVVVLEGKAKAADASVDGVRVVQADGSGDDAIVDVVAAAVERDSTRPITVVTADRELRERVAALGAGTVGPTWLWERLR
ncbi:NYN domain-containing protein [Nocardia sp. NPDC052316]|uniref:NYN domain-containing protein n=1 Tax=Nocardia sp. NPDC052316 TaxID=3364329 RepID=UPI0037C864F4